MDRPRDVARIKILTINSGIVLVSATPAELVTMDSVLIRGFGGHIYDPNPIIDEGNPKSTAGII